jgi:hypothetical protein
MKHGKALIALAAILALLVSPALAETKPKPLTDAEVAKLVTDWPAVIDWLEKKGKQIEAAPDGGISTAVFADREFTSFMAKKGWTIERFGYVSGTAFFLTGILALERENPDTIKQFDEAIAQVRASEAPADQKAEAVKQLEDAKKAMLSISSDKEINQDELKIVRSRFDGLYKLAQSMNGRAE